MSELSAQSQIENLRNEAQELEELKDYETSIEKQKTILKIAESIFNEDLQVSTLSKLGELYQQMSREQYEQALAIMRQPQRQPETGLPGVSPGDPLPLD